MMALLAGPQADVVNVWDAVAQTLPERASWIEGMGAGLEEAEERRRDAVEAALVDMVGGSAVGG